MNKKNCLWKKITAILCVLVLSGCVTKYPIKYELIPPKVVVSNTKIPLNVQLARFSDVRPAEERTGLSRETPLFTSQGGQGYTIDKGFNGLVAEEISKMVVEHLRFSGVFDSISLASFASEEISDSMLDALHEKGVDAVILGELNHFYGYYQYHPGLYWLYGISLSFVSALLLNFFFPSGTIRYILCWPPGFALGNYLESLHKRDIRYSTQLSLKMIRTSNREALWEGVFNVSRQLYDKMPGLLSWMSKRYEVAVSSLREVVNNIVTNLVSAGIKIN
jgi:hypothetical protein